MPTLLQLHVYCEVVPTVVELLDYSRRRVRRALLFGSLALLAMQVRTAHSWMAMATSMSTPLTRMTSPAPCSQLSWSARRHR